MTILVFVYLIPVVIILITNIKVFQMVRFSLYEYVSPRIGTLLDPPSSTLCPDLLERNSCSTTVRHRTTCRSHRGSYCHWFSRCLDALRRSRTDPYLCAVGSVSADRWHFTSDICQDQRCVRQRSLAFPNWIVWHSSSDGIHWSMWHGIVTFVSTCPSAPIRVMRPEVDKYWFCGFLLDKDWLFL